MNKSSFLLAAVLMSAAAAPSFAGDRTTGALIGAAAGTVIGGQTYGDNGAVIGAVLGAAVGASVASDHDHRYRGYDDRRYYGRGYASYDRYYAPPPRYGYYRERPREVVVYRQSPHYGYGRGREWRGYDRHDRDHGHDRRDWRGDDRGHRDDHRHSDRNRRYR